MFSIVVFTSCEGVETTSQAVNGRIEVGIVVVGKYYVKVAIQLGRSQFMESFTYEGKTYEVALRTLFFFFAATDKSDRWSARFLWCDYGNPKSERADIFRASSAQT